MTVVLETQTLKKRFGGVVALDGVSFTLREGEVHALCGENGAGKSTLIKILSGVHVHGTYEGEVQVAGATARFLGTRDAERAGVALIPQELALVPELTVAENLFLGREPRRKGLLGRVLIDWDQVYRDAAALFDELGLDLEPTARVGQLGVGKQQLVEIAKAIAKRTRVLVLDEPSAALTEQEVQVLLRVVRELRGRGVSAIYVSHKLPEIFALCDRITVLRDGRSVSTRDVKDSDEGALIADMVGREIRDFFPRRETHPGPALLEVKDLSVAPLAGAAPLLKRVSFAVHAGEVLGVGGLMGSGRTELLMHLFGAYGVRTGGSVTLLGAPFDRPTPSSAIERGLVLVSEDRKRWGLFHQQSVGFNLSLSALRLRVPEAGPLSSAGFLNAEREVRANRRAAEALRVKTAGLEAPVDSLSGGNQQKVVIGRALMGAPKVVLLDEPTRGIDVGAKVEVYELINRLTADGCAVLLVSSELPELLGMSDRILMLHEGTASEPFERKDATQERLLAAALGRATTPAASSRPPSPGNPDS
jgi:D-xylose transport system ATP-binding protein